MRASRLGHALGSVSAESGPNRNLPFQQHDGFDQELVPLSGDLIQDRFAQHKEICVDHHFPRSHSL